MKKLAVIIILSLLSATSGFSQASALLDSLASCRVSLEFSLSLEKGGAVTSLGSGTAVLEDGAYIVNAPGLCIICDGKTRLTMDTQALEAVLENADERDSLETYLHSASVVSLPDGRIQAKIEDADDSSLILLIGNVSYGPKKGKSDFPASGKSLSEDYFITDLR